MISHNDTHTLYNTDDRHDAYNIRITPSTMHATWVLGGPKGRPPLGGLPFGLPNTHDNTAYTHTMYDNPEPPNTYGTRYASNPQLCVCNTIISLLSVRLAKGEPPQSPPKGGRPFGQPNTHEYVTKYDTETPCKGSHVKLCQIFLVVVF